MNCPKGSEISIGEWLDQIGATSQFVGGDGDGPPDWAIQYKCHKIGVEVTLLHDHEGWGRTKEKAFEREIKRLIEEVLQEGEDMPRWHARCEYDPRVLRPPSKENSAWKDRVRDALRSSIGGKFQVLPERDIRGGGVVLELDPATNEGSFSGVSVDEGYAVQATITERIVALVKEKVNKIRNSEKAGCYHQWWLVFDDEILIVPIAVLSADERSRIEASVRECQDTVQLSKIVVVSRFQLTPPSVKQDKWFYAPWQDPRHPPLPPSPYMNGTASRPATQHAAEGLFDGIDRNHLCNNRSL